MDYQRLLNASQNNIHILPVIKEAYTEFLSELNKNMPSTTYVGLIHGVNIINNKTLLKTLNDMFKFPSYFGYNWDALEECINDLNWLHFKSYILILENVDKMQLSENDMQTFIKIITKAAGEWMEGRNYNRSFPTPPTPFHIIFAVEEERVSKTTKLLNKIGVQKIEILTNKKI
jgi:RNAse (barnase) inhibitor barstar